MRISSRGRGEEGRERITLVSENVDDLWHLSYVLEPGDFASGDTTRRVQHDDRQMRDTGGECEYLNVTIEVDDMESVRFTNRLRVGGVVVSCSREDQLSHHHTLSVEERAEITIEKQFKADQIDRIETVEQAVENPDMVIATVEEGAAYIYTVVQYGTEEYTSITRPTGKGECAHPWSELFDELGPVLSHFEVGAITLAGPDFMKDDAMSHFEDNSPAVVETIVTAVDTVSVGDRGVYEVLKRGAIDDVQRQTRIAEEANLIDELMENISTGVKAAYGAEQVAEATELGAVGHLLLLDSRLRAERQGDGDWDMDANNIIDSVEQKGGEVTVLSAEFRPGEQLKSLGSIVAVLRYRLQQPHAGETA